MTGGPAEAGNKGCLVVLSSEIDTLEVLDLCRRAGDYFLMESGASPDQSTVTAFFEDRPPGCAPEDSQKLGNRDADGRIWGIADLAFGYPEAADAYIGLLLVDPARRGAGLGARMLRALESLARERGASRMLVAVLDVNHRGRAFWEREGFTFDRSFEPRPFGARLHPVNRYTKCL